MKILQVETPALILHERILMKNIKTMQALADKMGIALRPHYKSVKCPAIAKLQIANGAKGITCAKLSEAQDLIDAGIEDILIANQIVDLQKIARAASLAKQCRLTVCVDQEENIEDLESAAAFADSVIYCLVELDIGQNRCGRTSFEELLSLAKSIIKKEHLRFEGIQAYAGHLAHETDYETRKAASDEANCKVAQLKEYFLQNGVPVKEVSGASTGTAGLKAGSVYTEIQAGSYVFMDASYNRVKLPFENSLFVLSTVISVNDNLIVLDAGMKSCATDQGLPEFLGDLSGCKSRMSEEHCTVISPGHQYQVKDKIAYIPGHCCTTVNLYDFLYLVRDDDVIDKIRIEGRGKSI